MIDTQYTSDPVCPWCGYKYMDAWELEMGDGSEQVIECGECEREYKVECVISVDYCTEKWTALQQAEKDLKNARYYEKNWRVRYSTNWLPGYEKVLAASNHDTCLLEARVAQLSQSEKP
jgi:hypothetical protein